MVAWRMSFRVGNQGHEMWPDCLRLGVAALTYSEFKKIDLSKHAQGEPKELWESLEPSQKASLRRVAYEMVGGDVIYAKQGAKIVDKGIVKGPIGKRAYKFDSQFRLLEPDGSPWAHQVPVDWSGTFPEIKLLLGAEQLTVKKLSDKEVEKLEAAVKTKQVKQDNSHLTWKSHRVLLLEDAYYRESPQRLKYIIPRHNKLSNSYCKWLKSAHGIHAVQEENRVDVRFTLANKSFLSELKVCFGVGTTKSIREALGQLLEYNHYPKRSKADLWLIVLDSTPTHHDKQYIQTLRDTHSLPLTLSWQTKQGFSFHPECPL